MSDEAVTVSEEDITVRKTVDTEQFQTVAVVLELISNRDDVVRVQVIDGVPDGVPMDDIGFHLDYGAEHWSVEDGTVVFERDLEPDEEYTTIYGIRDYPEDELEALRGEPDIGLIGAGSGDLESVVDEERSDVIRDFLSGETELSGLEETIGGADDDAVTAEPTTAESGSVASAEADGPGDQEADADLEEVVTPVSEPTSGPAAAGNAGDETAAASDDAAEAEEVEEDEEEAEEVSVPLSGGIVRVLIKELREGEVDPEHRQVLRDELLDTDGTMEARVSHLQQRMSDIEAYTSALEEFIAEEGGAQAVIDDLRADINDLEAEIETTPDRLEAAFDRIEWLDDQVETVADDAETALDRTTGLDDRLTGLEDVVDDIEDRIEDLRAELDSQRAALEEEVEEIEAELDELATFQDRLKSVFGDEGGPAGPS